MTRAGRLMVCVLVSFLCLPLFLKGRAHRDSGGAAFLRDDGKSVLVRLAGEFPSPGVYRFPAGATVATVTKMTLDPPVRARLAGGKGGTSLKSGNILTLSGKDTKTPVISLEKMSARERILFGISLDIDELGGSDWIALPGIGPALAGRIVEDRQRNGAFGSVDALARVRGIGPATVSRLRKYF